MEISYICFEISGQCNMNCKFCFSDWRNSEKQMSTEKAKNVLNVLKDCGLKAVNLTGGEPLLRDDIMEIAKYSKSLGLSTFICTNGILLPQKEEVLKYVDAINLPLDSVNQDIHNAMRPCALKNHHAHILYLIDYIKKNCPQLQIKINTMVGKPNLKEVVSIGEILRGKVQKWKLSKFFGSGNGAKFVNEFEITDSEFDEVIKNVKNQYDENMLTNDKYEDVKTYLFIDYLGNINANINGKIVNCGEISNMYDLDIKNVDKRDWKLKTVYKEK